MSECTSKTLRAFAETHYWTNRETLLAHANAWEKWEARIEALEKNTLVAQFNTMDKLGAGHMAMILGKKNSEAVKAAVFLTGEGTQEILDAIERIYNEQDAAALASGPPKEEDDNDE